jgi:phage terminase large subunit
MQDGGKQSLIRAARNALATAQTAVTAPSVVWLGLEETAEGFARRTAKIRAVHTGRLLFPMPVKFEAPPDCEPVRFIPRLFVALHPKNRKRYRVISGGRGSGKSHGIATAVVLAVLDRRVRVLCCREIMRSLRESVHHLLSEKIDALGLNSFFDINDREIRCTVTGSEIIFQGLFAHLSSLKSLEDISLVWCEESESVSARSIEILSPTVRAPNSELWFSINPDSDDGTIEKMVASERADVAHTHIVYSDNPYFPSVLEEERKYLERVDADAYEHVWLGKTRRISDAIIFSGRWRIDEFEPLPEWQSYRGCDFGFSSDPSAAVECFVADRRLYIRRELWALHLELDAMSQALEIALPGSRNYPLLCDSSRPESISFLQRSGHPHARAAAKWAGSILDGISFLRSFEEIIVHPSCQRMIEELKTYRYKIDKITGRPLTEPQDKNNHLCDALRYAVADMIMQSKNGAGILSWYAKEAAERNATAAITSDGTEPLSVRRILHFRNSALKIESIT